MYLVNEILVFTPGRRQEGLDRLGWIHSLMAPHAGFIQALVGRYQGDGIRHTVLRFWESADTFQKFHETPDGNYGRNRPEGLYQGESVVPRWESFAEAAGNVKGNFLVKVQREVPEGAWDAFTTYEKELVAARLALGGVEYIRQFRATDQSQALTIARLESRDVYERLLDSPDFSKVMLSAPEGVSLVRTEGFEVVSDVGPKK